EVAPVPVEGHTQAQIRLRLGRLVKLPNALRHGADAVLQAVDLVAHRPGGVDEEVDVELGPALGAADGQFDAVLPSGARGEVDGHAAVLPLHGGAADVPEQERPAIGPGADLLVAFLHDGAEQRLTGFVDDGEHVADRHVDVVDRDAEAAELVAVPEVIGEGGVVVDAARPQAGTLAVRGSDDAARRVGRCGGAGRRGRLFGRPAGGAGGGRRRGDGGVAGSVGERLFGRGTGAAGGAPVAVGVAAEPASAGVGRRRGRGGGRRRAVARAGGGLLIGGGRGAGTGREDGGGGDQTESDLIRHAGSDDADCPPVPGTCQDSWDATTTGARPPRGGAGRERRRPLAGGRRQAGVPAVAGGGRRREPPRHRGPRPVPLAGGREVARGPAVGEGPERLRPPPA